MAQALEDMDEVVAYVKNHNLGFTIPYTIDGEEQQYIPDFIVRIDDGHGPDDLLNLIVEVTGEARRRTRRPRSRPPATSGSRPSTTTAASAAGPSSRSATRGMRRTRFARL